MQLKLFGRTSKLFRDALCPVLNIMGYFAIGLVTKCCLGELDRNEKTLKLILFAMLKTRCSDALIHVVRLS